MLRLLLAGSLACLSACDGDGHIVPFGQETTPEEPTEAAPVPEVPAALEQALDGAESVDIEGATLSLEGRLLHGLLAQDVDSDGDRDALVIASQTSDEDNVELSLVFGRREGPHIVTRDLGTQRLPLCPEPVFTTAFSGDGPQRSAAITVQCGEERVVSHLVFRLDRTPRLIERLAVRGGDMALSFPDLDDDEHADLRAVVTLFGQDITLDWLDRAGGLAPVAGEPSATLSAARGTENAHALARALCGPDAAVSVGGRWGLDCPAAATQGIRLDAALAHAGEDLARALHEAREFDEEERREFFERIERPTVSWRRIEHTLPRTGATRHAGMSFVDERTLVDHATGVTIPLVGAGEPHLGGAPIPSPDDSLAVRSLTSRGPLHEINLVQSAGGAFHAPVFRALTIPSPPTGEWLVLGWAPQGLLLFDGVERFLLGVSGTESTDLRAIGADDALPAPFRGARTDASGDLWIAETSFGVLRGESGELSLWRPDEWEDGVETLAAAMSPSGRRIAVARENGVFLMSQGSPAPTPQPGTNTAMSAAPAPTPAPNGDLQAP